MTPGTRPTSWFRRFERKLLGVLGPAQVSPPGDPPTAGPPARAVCPACGRPMAEHQVDRRGNHNRVTCPTARQGH
jgi:hypothetical protein